jgi:hypothetical protein
VARKATRTTAKKAVRKVAKRATKAAAPKRARRKQSPVARVKRVATEVGTQAMDAGKTVVEEAKNVGERVFDFTSDMVNKVT